MESDDEQVEVFYQVEEILNKRTSKDGKIEYLIRWKGFKQKTWQPVAHLHNVANMIYDYQLTNKNNKSKPDTNSKNITREINQSTVRRKRLHKFTHRDSETSNKPDNQSSIDSRRYECMIDSRAQQKRQESEDHPRVKFTKDFQQQLKPSNNSQNGSLYIDQVERILAVERRNDKWMAKVRFAGRFEDTWQERDLVRLLHSYKLLEFYQDLYKQKHHS